MTLKPICLAISLILAATSLLQAQSELKESEKSILIFDVDIAQLNQSEIVKAIGIENVLNEVDMMPPGDEFDVKSLRRIYGAAQLPESMLAVMEMGEGDDIPFEFFVRIEFSDAKAVETLLEEVKENSRKTEKGDKVYYQPPEGEGPDNLYVHEVNDKTVELGTAAYIFRADRNVVTDQVAKQWKDLPEHAIRFCIDVDAGRDFVDEMVDMMSQGAPPEAEDFFKIVNDVSKLSMIFDPGQDRLFSLVGESKNKEAADNLRGGLDGILFLARTGGKQWLKEMPVQDKQAQSMMTEIVNQFKTKQEGNRVSITIEKPDDFDRIIKDVIVKEIKKAQAEAERMSRFRNFAIGIHNYHDAFKRMPFTVTEDMGFHPGLSWRVRITPFIELNKIYSEMNMKESWDSDTNKPWATKMPKEFGTDGKNTDVCWIKSDVTRFATIRDGTSQTVMLLESPKGVPWTQAKDLTAEEAVKLVTSLKDGESLVAVFYDASCRIFTNKIDKETLQALMSTDGGEIVDWDDKGVPKLVK